MREIDQIGKCSWLLAAVLAGCSGHGNGNGANDMAMDACSRGTVENACSHRRGRDPASTPTATSRPGSTW